MLPDTQMIIHEFPKNEDITIYAIADVHLGAQEHMKTEWEEFCQRVQSEKAYLIIGGDLINNGTKTSVTNCYDEVMRPSLQKKRMAEMLYPLRKKILCFVPGNHEGRNKDVDDCPMYDIACKLDLEDLYRENMAFLKIRIGDSDGYGKTNPTYMIVVAHGSGGGALTGGVVNRAERFGYAIDGADALILGHSHKPFQTMPGKIKIDPYNNKVTIRPFRVISVTSWLSWGGYAARKMLSPTSFAPQTITLCGNEKKMTVQM